MHGVLYKLSCQANPETNAVLLFAKSTYQLSLARAARQRGATPNGSSASQMRK